MEVVMGNKHWSDKEIDFVRNTYSLISNAEIAQRLNRSIRAVEHKVSYLGIGQTRKYELNEDYFYYWSHRMAYILGFTMADGCVSFDCDKSYYRLSYGLQDNDKEILQFISNELYKADRTTYHKEKSRLGTICDTVRLKFNSKKIVSRLSDFNIIPRKTGKEIWPNIPNKYQFSYLLGFFDGDGSVSIKNGKYQHRNLHYYCANKRFLQSVNTLIGDVGKIYQKGNCYMLSVYSQDDVYRIADNMYANTDFSLSRKKDKIYG